MGQIKHIFGALWIENDTAVISEHFLFFSYWSLTTEGNSALPYLA